MIEINWGKPLSFVISPDGDIQEFTTAEQAHYWLRKRWPVADTARDRALHQIRAAMTAWFPWAPRAAPSSRPRRPRASGQKAASPRPHARPPRDAAPACTPGRDPRIAPRGGTIAQDVGRRPPRAGPRPLRRQRPVAFAACTAFAFRMNRHLNILVIESDETRARTVADALAQDGTCRVVILSLIHI